METPRPQHLRGADELAPWVAGSQIAWDALARRHAPFTPWRPQDNDGDPFESLTEFLNRMPTQVQARRAAEAGRTQHEEEEEGSSPSSGSHVSPIAITNRVRPTLHTPRAEYVDDAYRNGGFGAVPASSEAIAGLPVISAGDADAREQGRACTVCLQDFEGGDTLRRLPCSHLFHEHCIVDWLRVSRACPLCRHRLPMERQ